MARLVQARVRFLALHEGGRRSPPSSRHYAALAWLGGAPWSIAVEFETPPSSGGAHLARLVLPVPSTGRHIDLYEGTKLVAHATVEGS